MITLNDALTANEFWHMTLANANLKLADAKPGTPPTKCRRNGATKTWKKWPGLFRIPVKYGLKSCFYIQNFDYRDANVPAGSDQGRNDADWCTPTKWPAEHVLFEGVPTPTTVPPSADPVWMNTSALSAAALRRLGKVREQA